MSDEPLRVAVIVGSTREGRFGGAVARWFVGRARRRAGFTVDEIDLAELDLPFVYPAEPDERVRRYVERIDRADAFVVVTPEYNHGYPASLKQAIDLPRGEWRRKPVAFVSYGGIGGGLRAVEQLRQLFPELHAMTIRDVVSFHHPSRWFDDDAVPLDEEGCNTAVEVMLDDLAWWGEALRRARKELGR
jgi:NAD(P)H-dependent FMN reductase